MGFSITDRAVEKAKELRSSQNMPEDWVLCVGLTGGGCSGFKYMLDLVAPPEDEALYRSIEHDGLRVLCDRKSYLFLVGTEIDYEESLMSSGFTFNSPTATAKCGCGESVSF